MTKSWVYILDDGTGWFYVGTTDRLFRRMREHAQGKGAKVTSKFFYGYLVGLYKLGEKDEVNNRLDIENLITLQLMKLQDNPKKVRGGNYCKHGLDDNAWDLPLACIKKLKSCEMPVVCECGLPANKFNSRNGEVFYKCAISSASWINEEDFPISIADPCTFFKFAINATKADEPNFCLTCDVPCGQFTRCYTHYVIKSHGNLEDIEII